MNTHYFLPLATLLLHVSSSSGFIQLLRAFIFLFLFVFEVLLMEIAHFTPMHSVAKQSNIAPPQYVTHAFAKRSCCDSQILTHTCCNN
jgi:hypothetical protein